MINYRLYAMNDGSPALSIYDPKIGQTEFAGNNEISDLIEYLLPYSIKPDRPIQICSRPSPLFAQRLQLSPATSQQKNELTREAQKRGIELIWDSEDEDPTDKLWPTILDSPKIGIN